MATEKTSAEEKKTPAAKAPKGPEMVWVQSVHGPMLNLHSNVWYGADPKKVELDDFVRGQLAAGKLVTVEP